MSCSYVSRNNQRWPKCCKNSACIFSSSHTRSLMQESEQSRWTFMHMEPQCSQWASIDHKETPRIYQPGETRPHLGNVLTLVEQKAGTVQKWEVKGPQIIGHWKTISSCHSFAILLVQCFGHKLTRTCIFTTQILESHPSAVIFASSLNPSSVGFAVISSLLHASSNLNPIISPAKLPVASEKASKSTDSKTQFFFYSYQPCVGFILN